MIFLPPIFTLFPCSALKIEVIYSSETSDNFQQTTRSLAPEDNTRHNHRYENLKSFKIILILKLSASSFCIIHVSSRIELFTAMQ
jgi:hypothetical protein